MLRVGFTIRLLQVGCTQPTFHVVAKFKNKRDGVDLSQTYVLSCLTFKLTSPGFPFEQLKIIFNN